MSKRLLPACIIVFLFMLVELTFGFISHSLVLISDSMHLLVDVGSLFLGYIAFRLSQKKQNLRFTYGYGRAQIIFANLNALFLLLVTVWIVYEAVGRLIENQHPSQPLFIFLIGSLSLLVNLFLLFFLHGHHDHHGHHGHQHGHHHQHHGQDGKRVTEGKQKGKSSPHNLNMQAVIIHVISDLLLSIGTILAGLFMFFFHWYILDALGSIIFSLVIIPKTILVIKQCFHILMEASPKDLDNKQIEKKIESIPGVKQAHDLHSWLLDDKKLMITMHILIEPSFDHDSLLIQVKHLLDQIWPNCHSVIQMEKLTRDQDCEHCSLL